MVIYTIDENKFLKCDTTRLQNHKSADDDNNLWYSYTLFAPQILLQSDELNKTNTRVQVRVSASAFKGDLNNHTSK